MSKYVFLKYAVNKYIFQSNNKYYLEDHLSIQISELTAIVQINVQCFDITNDHFLILSCEKICIYKYTNATIYKMKLIYKNYFLSLKCFKFFKFFFY